MVWLWVALWVVGGSALFLVLLFGFFHIYLRVKYLDKVVRIFQEKPLFIIPRGQPLEDAEAVCFLSADGLKMSGCYLKALTPRRVGVILFGLEFGSNRWAAGPYCEFLRRAGFDIFTFEPRGQGESDCQPGYEPLQWVTEYEVCDFQAALAYLRSRPDADPRGIGLFGLSKGGGAGLLAAAQDDYIRCFVTDGIFGTHTTMVPYMQKWIAIYNTKYRLQKLLPRFVYSLIAYDALRVISRERRCRFPRLERAVRQLGGRPLLMIHGGGDTYIKPEMAQTLFDRARQPKELWLVKGAKHNQAFHLANGEYQRRVLAFFTAHLADGEPGESTPQTPAPSPPTEGLAEGRSPTISPSITS